VAIDLPPFPESDCHALFPATPRRQLGIGGGPGSPVLAATNKSRNAEFVRLPNTSRTAGQLRGWTISDSNGHVYRFGRLRLRPGGSVTVHSGRGRDPRRDRYWNRRGYVWDNTRELVRVHTPRGGLADQCRYDNSHASQLRC
jgi:Lamin Tail Domain